MADDEAAQPPPPAKKIKTTVINDEKVALAATVPVAVAPRCSLCQRFPVQNRGYEPSYPGGEKKCAQCLWALDGHLPYCRACDTFHLYPSEDKFDYVDECERCCASLLMYQPYLPVRRSGTRQRRHDRRTAGLPLLSDDDDNNEQQQQRECYICGINRPRIEYSPFQWYETQSICSHCFPEDGEQQQAMDHAWSKDRLICDELWRHGLQCYDGYNIQVSAWDSSVKKKEDVAGFYDLVFLSFTSGDPGPEFGRLKQSRTAIGTLELWDDADKPFVANDALRHGESYTFQGKGRIDNAYSTYGMLCHTSFTFGVWTTAEGWWVRPGEGSIRDDAAPMEMEMSGSDVTLKWIAGRTGSGGP
jgi:hypothetical protein